MVCFSFVRWALVILCALLVVSVSADGDGNRTDARIGTRPDADVILGNFARNTLDKSLDVGDDGKINTSASEVSSGRAAGTRTVSPTGNSTSDKSLGVGSDGENNASGTNRTSRQIGGMLTGPFTRKAASDKSLDVGNDGNNNASTSSRTSGQVEDVPTASSTGKKTVKVRNATGSAGEHGIVRGNKSNATVRVQVENSTMARTKMSIEGVPMQSVRIAREEQQLMGDSMSRSAQIASLMERFSSALEGIGTEMRNVLWGKDAKHTVEKISRNETLLIGFVPKKRLHASIAGKGHEGVIQPVQAVFSRGRLDVVVEEAAHVETNDVSEKLAEEFVGVAMLYRIQVGRHMVDVDHVYLRPMEGEASGYEIVVPLKQRHSRSGIWRTSSRSSSSKRVESTASKHEEDDYEFLQLQMECRKQFGSAGVEKMLCTCGRAHVNDVERRFSCLSRVTDKVVRVARRAGERRIAKRIRHESSRCRNAKLGAIGSYQCLVKVLRASAGRTSALVEKHGRTILSKKTRTLADMLADEDLKVEDVMVLDEDEEDVMGEVGSRSSITRLFLLVAYAAGALLLLACLLDLRTQYHVHKAQARRMSDFSRLPEHAQALYSRLATIV